jgi:hypothetical protein
MAKRTAPSKHTSFSQRHGSQSPVVKKPVTESQLGHDQQLPVNPPTPMGSPLINPGEPGHPMSMPGSLGQSMNYPSGEDFY